MPSMTASSFFGLGVEDTRGTPVAATDYVPVTEPKWKPDITWLQDKGLRNSPNELYSEQAGVRHDEYDYKGFTFLDTVPNLLRAVLGVDTVTGTAAPYTHTITQYISIANASQPPSYTLVDFDAGVAGATTARQMAMGQLSDLSFDFSAKGALGYTAKFLTAAQGTVSTPTPSFSSEIFVPSWNCAVSLGTVQSSVVEEGSISIKRNVEAIHTLGTQSAYRLFAAPLAVDGKIGFVAENSTSAPSEPFVASTVITDSTTTDPQVIKLIFTEPVSGHTMTLQTSQTQLKDPDVDRGKAYVRIMTNFNAQGNTTDGAAGNYAPMRAVVQNARSTAY